MIWKWEETINSLILIEIHHQMEMMDQSILKMLLLINYQQQEKYLLGPGLIGNLIHLQASEIHKVLEEDVTILPDLHIQLQIHYKQIYALIMMDYQLLDLLITLHLHHKKDLFNYQMI